MMLARNSWARLLHHPTTATTTSSLITPVRCSLHLSVAATNTRSIYPAPILSHALYPIVTTTTATTTGDLAACERDPDLV
jgi:hypothetical protein